jgi:hypothetical protein
MSQNYGWTARKFKNTTRKFRVVFLKCRVFELLKSVLEEQKLYVEIKLISDICDFIYNTHFFFSKKFWKKIKKYPLFSGKSIISGLGEMKRWQH